ncbi:putative autophagy-related protein 27 [Rosellinia necatrix]|uniref:Autophagy-related protein 27 n=1 Tax=Rosellinia necatrix TaxID=77044 RepID=A0A1S7UK69_ROSNE|nr:putative autophagy-related protein 27 [Rosellinia necatrix]
MKVPAIPYADAALVLSLLLAPVPTAAAFNCDQVVSDGQRFNLKGLGGPHSVVTSLVEGNRIHNTTYTVDICAPLKKKGDVKPEDQCKNGSRACAIRRLIKTGESVDTIEEVTPLAGELADHGGASLDPEVSRLSKIDPESGKEGLHVLLKGGYGYTADGHKRKKHTVINFVCNKDLDGTEGEYKSEDKYEPSNAPHAVQAKDNEDDGKDGKDDEGEGEGEGDENAPPKEVQLGIEKNPSLVFDGYGPSDGDTNVDVLHLTWSSKYVCESRADDGEGGGGGNDGDVKRPGSHWGAFTWIVLLFFLGTAAYLIFGSWLNYNRYGARGWDLLPHGDTIRDIPYLMKDWVRRVLNTVQGSGSRGGYSAV